MRIIVLRKRGKKKKEKKKAVEKESKKCLAFITVISIRTLPGWRVWITRTTGNDGKSSQRTERKQSFKKKKRN